MANLDFKTRATYTRAILAAGLTPATYDDDALRAQYDSLNSSPVTQPAQKAEPTPVQKPVQTRTNKIDLKPKVEPLKVIEGDKAAQALEVLKGLIGGGDSTGISEARIIELIKAHSSLSISIYDTERDTTQKIDGAHESLKTVIDLLACRLNVYMYGPAGSGKTTIAKHAAQAFGLDFHFTGAVLQKYELLGFIDAGGVYQTTSFRQAFELGGVFLFDEMDASSAAALIAFNAAIANGICAFPDKTITAHKDFLVCAASNTNGNGASNAYLRNKLDKATLDRYQFLEVGYDLKLERAVALAIADKHGLDTDFIDSVLSRVELIRFNNDAFDVGAVVSPRTTFALVEMIASGRFTTETAFNLAVFNKVSDDQAAQLRAK